MARQIHFSHLLMDFARQFSLLTRSADSVSTRTPGFHTFVCLFINIKVHCYAFEHIFQTRLSSWRAHLIPHPPADVSVPRLPLCPPHTFLSLALFSHHHHHHLLLLGSFTLLPGDSHCHLSPDGQRSVTVLGHTDQGPLSLSLSFSLPHTHTHIQLPSCRISWLSGTRCGDNEENPINFFKDNSAASPVI